MANKKLHLTRSQLSAFLKDHESIKQFEQLFSVVDDIAPDFFNEVAIAAGIADSKGQQAIDAINRLSNSIEMAALSVNHDQQARNKEVLAWLSM